jgi:hypothetical protein
VSSAYVPLLQLRASESSLHHIREMVACRLCRQARGHAGPVNLPAGGCGFQMSRCTPAGPGPQRPRPTHTPSTPSPTGGYQQVSVNTLRSCLLTHPRTHPPTCSRVSYAALMRYSCGTASRSRLASSSSSNLVRCDSSWCSDRGAANRDTSNSAAGPCRGERTTAGGAGGMGQPTHCNVTFCLLTNRMTVGAVHRQCRGMLACLD